MGNLYEYTMGRIKTSKLGFDDFYIDIELDRSKPDEPQHMYQSIVKQYDQDEGLSRFSDTTELAELDTTTTICNKLKDLKPFDPVTEELGERDKNDILYGPITHEQHEQIIKFNSLNNKEQLVWFMELFEHFWYTRTRSFSSKGSRQSIVDDIKMLHNTLGGPKKFFNVGQGVFKLPPFTYFLVKEELYHFSICISLNQTVSVDDYRSDVTTLTLNEKVAHAVLLDVNAPLRDDQGLRFILLGQSDNPNKNQTLSTPSNAALLQSWLHEIPIRVVRAYNCHSRFAPLWGYRYDGLYRIIDVYSDTNNDGIRIWVFIFSACNENIIPPSHVYTEQMEATLYKIRDPHTRMRVAYQIQARAKIQRAIPLKRSEYIKQVDVVYNGKKLFTIGVSYMLKKRPCDKYPAVLNLYCIYKFIVKICMERKLATGWLNNEVHKYQTYENLNVSQDKLQESHTVMWALGGFLPLVLGIQKIDKKRLTLDEMCDKLDDKRVEKYCEHVEYIPINKEMARISARQFFPQSEIDFIWTFIHLKGPFPDTWDPREDISAGTETFPIPVENDIDKEMPPMGFTYVTSNVFLSRLPRLDFEPICSGCLPPNFESIDNFDRIAINGFCRALKNRKNGMIYCEGVNKVYLSAIQIHASCSDNCLCPSNCTNRLPEGIQVPVKLVKTALLDWELHTQIFIPKGTYIMQYVGEGISRSEMVAREHKYDKMGLFNYCMEAVEMEKEVDDWLMPCIDSMFIGNIARFLNHSCEPNVQVVTVWRGEDFPCIGVYSLCDIAAGDALTYCYGSAYKSIPCLCCSPQCKGYIGIN
ncbi:Histone-lysine N-methyltransferase EHMT1 [Babesia microti strain RI]|uniref:Histone-lysine N-methyltransferase EHMT1 n=1 Tax=Babesia microti (strain RI) TaxID=1133968 RepID=A0A1N6LWQ7_BABMR|nr:Histone-lysine N-methyltransferase EHMT1 [Babesia microti strain RI]SIO73304.1 Histone-lysine N-methyltransferase EHMT1 [Babesia microti strain RI]|eukprot:XP_021337406.1 Histone-lysine N-methyltransferase EHMT1 [Babesia microti strain RI]